MLYLVISLPRNDYLWLTIYDLSMTIYDYLWLSMTIYDYHGLLNGLIPLLLVKAPSHWYPSPLLEDPVLQPCRFWRGGACARPDAYSTWVAGKSTKHGRLFKRKIIYIWCIIMDIWLPCLMTPEGNMPYNMQLFVYTSWPPSYKLVQKPLLTRFIAPVNSPHKPSLTRNQLAYGAPPCSYLWAACVVDM